jgi:hypothetical protein
MLDVTKMLIFQNEFTDPRHLNISNDLDNRDQVSCFANLTGNRNKSIISEIEFSRLENIFSSFGLLQF